MAPTKRDILNRLLATFNGIQEAEYSVNECCGEYDIVPNLPKLYSRVDYGPAVHGKPRPTKELHDRSIEHATERLLHAMNLI